MLLSALWVGWRTYQAYRHLDAAAEQVSALQLQVRNIDDIDVSAANKTVVSLQAEADGAVDATSDPVFRLAAHLPWIGPTLDAVSKIADTVKGLATGAAPSLLDVARTVRPAALAPKNGVIALAPISAASDRLQAAAREVGAATARMAAIDRGALVDAVAGG